MCALSGFRFEWPVFRENMPRNGGHWASERALFCFLAQQLLCVNWFSKIHCIRIYLSHFDEHFSFVLFRARRITSSERSRSTDLLKMRGKVSWKTQNMHVSCRPAPKRSSSNKLGIGITKVNFSCSTVYSVIIPYLDWISNSQFQSRALDC